MALTLTALGGNFDGDVVWVLPDVDESDCNDIKTMLSIVKTMLRANSYWIQQLRDQSADKVVSHFARGAHSHQLLEYIHPS